MKPRNLLLKSAILLLSLFAIVTANSFKASATCQASFTWTQSADSVITFTSTSTGTTVNSSYYWSFGDGNNSSLQNPIHTYSTAGTYYVCFHIMDSACSSYF